MKLNGEFTLREIAGEVLVIPVGSTALELNGMIILNPVSKVIWECLQAETTAEEILKTVIDTFDVDTENARLDILEFLEELRRQNLICE